MVKKIVLSLLSVSLMVGAAALPADLLTNVGGNTSVTANADKWVNNYGYKELSNGTVAITWYGGKTQNISIPSKLAGKKVSTIASYAFGQNNVVRKVTLPSTVKTIESYAFTSCKNLQSIKIPGSVTKIGDNAFNYCEKLVSINIPKGVKAIEDFTFWGCKNLKSVTIPSTVTSLGYACFDNCSSLSAVNIPDSVKNIGECAFWDCSNLQNVTMSKNLTKLGNYVFYGCTKLKKLILPASLKSIGSLAFGTYSNNNTVKTVPGFKAFCIKNSYAESYSKKNNIPYSNYLGYLTGLKATSNSNSIKLTWNKVKGAQGYKILKYDFKSKKYVTYKKSSTNSLVISNLKSAEGFRFAVSAYNDKISSTTAKVSAATAPKSTSFTVVGGTKKAVLKWKKADRAKGYRIYYKTSSNGSWKLLKAVNSKTYSYTRTNLAKGKKYYFTVRPYTVFDGKIYVSGGVTKSVRIK